ncbi:hypothetical protein AB1Y20_000018 [Prymnesium parvum]|uniref:Uncharacterized protein n=1 Tax=Prymnesium parvum TaxID=97485 RepID=A0AB34K4N4_PRYPA
MGGVGSKCCGASAAPKDKNDKYIDDVEYEPVNVPSIDEAFTPAFEVLQTAVATNNALWKSVDTVKLVGSVLLGALSSELAIKESSVKFALVKEDDAGERLTVAEVHGGAEAVVEKSEADFKLVKEKPEANAAIEACSAALAKLNDALKEASMVGVKVGPGNRLECVAGDVGNDAAAKKQLDEAKLAVQGFNNTYFGVKNQLVMMGLSGGLSQALTEMVTNIKALVQDVKPTVNINYEKLMEGELDLKPDLGVNVQKIANTCPKKVKKCVDAVFGEKFLTTGEPMSEGGLMGTLVDTAKQSAELMSKCNESMEAVKALASDPAALITKAKEAGFEQMAAMKVPGKVAKNAKNASKTPLILADLFKTIKEVSQEVKTGLAGASGTVADAS